MDVRCFRCEARRRGGSHERPHAASVAEHRRDESECAHLRRRGPELGPGAQEVPLDIQEIPSTLAELLAYDARSPTLSSSHAADSGRRTAKGNALTVCVDSASDARVAFQTC